MTEDTELLRLYAEERSEAAFAELVQRHLALVYSTALRQLNGDVHAAEDVAQTVFTALARKGSSLSSHRTIAGWLYLSVHHAAAQLVRGETRRRAREHEAHSMHEFFASFESAADWDRVRPVLDDAMRELGDADREAVLLRFFERRPFADIGPIFKLSEDAARMRVDRALEKLRVLLAHRGITSTAAALATALGNQAMVAAPTGLAATITGSALAGLATVTTTAALTTGLFMSKITATISVIALAAIGSAVFFAKQAHHSASLTAETTRELTVLRAKVADVEKRANLAEQQSAMLKKDLAGILVEKNPATTGFAFSTTSTNSQPRIFSLPAPPDPAEAKRQLRVRNGASIEANYAALFRQLDFTPDQVEHFKNLKLDLMEKGNEIFRARAAAAKTGNPSISRDEMQKVAEQTGAENYAELQTALRSTFGDDFHEKFQLYESNAPARFVASQLANSLFYTASPLTPSQADELVAIISKQPRDTQGKLDLTTANPVAIFEAAKAVLSPTQLLAFRQIITSETRKFIPEERLLDSVQHPVTSRYRVAPASP